MKIIHLKDQQFQLHSSGALYWQNQDLLLIADVHLGKVTHFRKHGSAVPMSAALSNFNKLRGVWSFFKPGGIIFLGDLFHSSINFEWNLFEECLDEFHGDIALIRGNHDVLGSSLYEENKLRVLEHMQIGEFLLTHHPDRSTKFFNICGHLHPAVRMKGTGGQSVKLPCFYRNSHQMILPAFGLMTGHHVLRPSPKDEVFALVEDSVLRVH